MNPSNAWENFSDIYSSSSSAYFSVKRAGQVVNTVNHSLVLPELLSPKRLHLFTTTRWVQSCVKFSNRPKTYNASTVRCVTFNTPGTRAKHNYHVKADWRNFINVVELSSRIKRSAYRPVATAAQCEGDTFTIHVLFAGFGLFLTAADTLQCSMTCHHHPARATVAAQRRTHPPANPISLPMMTPLCCRRDTLLHDGILHKHLSSRLHPLIRGRVTGGNSASRGPQTFTSQVWASVAIEARHQVLGLHRGLFPVYTQTCATEPRGTQIFTILHSYSGCRLTTMAHLFRLFCPH